MTTFILVLDKYAQPDRWVYSAQADSAEALLALNCYEDPPNSDPKDQYNVVSSQRTSKRRCGAEAPDPGTIYGLDHV